MHHTNTPQRLAIALAILLAPAAAVGQGGGQTAEAQLRDDDDLPAWVNQRVTLPGEVDDLLDAGAFVLEGEGDFDDELVVVIPKNALGLTATALREDMDIIVTGVIRDRPAAQIERELGLTLGPKARAEIAEDRYYLVAERIQPRRG